MIRHIRPRRIRVVGVAGVIGAALVVAGCGSSASSTSTGSSASSATAATVSTATVAGLGTVLVDSQGRTLYMFVPDHHAKVTCTGACASVWPPLTLAAGTAPAAGGSAKASLLGSVPSPSGGRVVTYTGWPLYTYVADTTSGMAQGQALNLNGGLWYVLSPSGAVITKKG